MMSYIDPGRRARRIALGAIVLSVMLATAFASAGSGTVYANTCQNLITNGSIEESGDGWITQSNGSYSLFSNYQAYTGKQSAYLGGVDSAQDQIRQTLALPANQKLTLTFWWLVNTTEMSAGWDGMTVQVADANGVPLRVLFAVSDRSAGLSWKQAALDLSDFGGQTIQLQFNARTDASLATDFFIDEVAVMACEPNQAGGKIFLPTLRR
jgi:bacillopeptidase F (M6 metalloprotease family)